MSVQRRTVLIVEDDVDVRNVLRVILGRTYDVSIADNGEAALWRFMSGERFDVVLCDLYMPKMDGATLVDHLRRVAPDQAQRLIVLTANIDSLEAAQVADHCIVEKPFNVTKLRELIDRVSTAARDGYFPSSASG